MKFIESLINTHKDVLGRLIKFHRPQSATSKKPTDYGSVPIDQQPIRIPIPVNQTGNNLGVGLDFCLLHSGLESLFPIRRTNHAARLRQEFSETLVCWLCFYSGKTRVSDENFMTFNQQAR